MTTTISPSPRIEIKIANPTEQQDVYRLRHDVYCTELHQYPPRPDNHLPDNPDIKSIYITATIDDTLVGFIGITPPSSPHYSLEKHIARKHLPNLPREHTYEIRALTVKDAKRGSFIASSLMYAAFRYIQSQNGQHIISIGRKEVLSMYLRFGFQPINQPFNTGHVQYQLMAVNVDQILSHLNTLKPKIKRMGNRLNWKLNITFNPPTECYHGGAFFNAIGERFDNLHRANQIINADVLDAWFPPAPQVQQALIEHLPFIMRTSPPTQSNGLIQNIAEARNIAPNCILPGSGSSSLIFLAFRHWLTPDSKVLLLDPTYGEYAHVLENLIQCQVDRLKLQRKNKYQLNLNQLEQQLIRHNYDLFVWVNPNSPTGQHVARQDVQSILNTSSANCKRVWIDETYIEYVGHQHSLESYAMHSHNTIVCKSMSKVYALSGMRAAYLCAAPHHIEPLKIISPPWSVSLPAQIAASKALLANDYYQHKYNQTHTLRENLTQNLHQLGITEIIPGSANFILFHLPPSAKPAAQVVKECRQHNLYIRDASNMGTNMGQHALRIAVKDAPTNQQMIHILKKVLT